MKYWQKAILLAGLLAVGGCQETGAEDASVSDGIPEAAPATQELRPKAEKFEFQAEVNRLMDIIIHSLYSNKDIFLRELISNASDALDKIRLLALSDPDVLGDSAGTDLEIRIDVDKEANILRIHDKGVGMSRDDLIANLGTIAKSGTSSFLEKMQQTGDANLIGQFGVGFYSVYLVSDYVEVITKSAGGAQYVWESKSNGGYAISEDPAGALSGEGDLGRGTMIKIHLKEENQEYSQTHRIKELIKKYSEFINFPIYMKTTKEVEVEADDAAEDADDDDKADDDDEIEDDDDEDSADEDDATPKVMETVTDWELLNSQRAIWLRQPQDVEEEEYQKFFSALSKDDTASAIAHAHFKAEGDVEFRSILYIPSKAPWDYYDTYYTRNPQVKLYVRRVFISDDFADLLPRYLSFLLGLVDSDTLPLNVSREMLQQHSSLKTIKKKLVRKALEMIKRMSEAQVEGRAMLEERADDADDDEDSKAAEADIKKYDDFWAAFGKAVKLGVVEDANNRNRLAKVLRVHSSKSVSTLTTLDEYVSRMKPGQKAIYYICGQSMDEVQRSPFLEQLLEQDYEIIYFTEPMDEYMMQNLLEYEDSKFQSANKEDLKLGDDEAGAAKREKALKAAFRPLTKWWRKALGSDSNLENVRVSNRLAGTPCVVVTSKYGWSANMQRIMQAQALGDPSRQASMMGKRTLEINPRHPLIVELLAKVEADPEDFAARDTASLLYETALLESGYPMQDDKAFAGRVYEIMKRQLGVTRELADLHPELDLSDIPDDEPAAGDSDGDAKPAFDADSLIDNAEAFEHDEL